MSRRDGPGDRPIGETELERALLRAGRSYGSSPRARARTLAALGLTGSTAAGLGAAAAAALAEAGVPAGAKATLAAGGALGKIAAGFALAAALGAVPIVYYATRDRDRSPGAPIEAAPPAAPAPRPVPPLDEAAGDDARPPAPASAAAPARARAVAAGARAARGEGKPAVTLTDELLALDAARAALAAGDAERALAQLDGYARAYPSGHLELEAEILRIDALARSGHRDVARRRAEQFLRRHPKSVLAPRARGFLDD